MRPLLERLFRLPWGDVTRRALEETAADAVHEMSAAPTPTRRLGRLGAGLAAVIRVVALAFASIGEGEHPMRNLGHDLRLAWRRLRATPAFVLFAVITLALGIGATTAIFSVVHAAMGPPPGVTTIDRLVNITHTEAGSLPIIGLSYGDYLDLRARQTVFTHVAGWFFFQQAFSANGQAETAFGEAVSGEYFETLGVTPALGRAIQSADDVPGAPPVAVISNGVWRRMFGGARDVVGKSIRLNGVMFEIVGVAPRSFAGLFNGGLIPSAMWIPLNASRLLPMIPASDYFDRDNRSHRWLQVRALLKPGVTLEEARAQVTGIARQLDQAYPIGRDLDPRLRMPWAVSRPWVVRRTADVPVNESAAVMIGPMTAVVMSAVGLVLLVACTNLANLMLARHSGRQHELAVRLALGASRWRLVRESVVEDLIIAGAGGLLGVGVARVALVFLGRDLPVANGLALHLAPRLDPAVLLLAAAATFLALLVFGLVPAMQATRADVRSALTADGSHSAAPRWRGRRFLIAMQVMVSVMLLSTAALYVAQLRAMSQLDGGIDLRHLAVAQVDFGSQQIESARTHQIVDAVLAQIRRRPDVRAAAASSGLPVGLQTPGCMVGVPRPSRLLPLVAATPGIFDTLGVAIVHGRAFDARDTTDSEPVIVISERTAKGLFGRTDVVGQHVVFQRRQFVGEAVPPVETLTVIGVAADTDSGQVGSHTRGVAYLPLSQQDEGRLALTVRALGNPEPLVGALRQAIASVEPDLAVTQVGTGEAVAGPAGMIFLEIVSGFSGILGMLALALALAGLYGVLAHIVARRTREVGVRVALGASRKDILRLVLRDGLHPVASGIVAGLAIGVIARMTLRPVFVRLLPAVDPVMLTAIPLAMLAAALVACYIPARRAAEVDPNVALRDL